MTRPSVSVILPTRERIDFLRQALRSTLAQRDVSLEVIVIDDGTAGGCEHVVDEAGDDRVRLVVHDGSRGVSEARNSGIAAARADWLAFLDDDDLLAPDNLSAHLARLRMDPDAMWSCVGSVHIDSRMTVVGSSTPPDPKRVPILVRWANVIPLPSCVVVARRAIEAAGYFDPAFACHADWDLWLRLAPLAPMTTISRPLTAYRLHDGNMSSNSDAWDEEFRKLQDKHGLPTPGSEDVDRERGQLERARAWSHLRAGRHRRSAQEMLALARSTRDWRAAVCAAGIAVAPRAMGMFDAARLRRQVPDAWRWEAEEWLRSYRADRA